VIRTRHDPIESLRDALEAQFQQNTDRLTELTVRLRHTDGARDGEGDRAALVAARRAVAETAHALRRMAEGSYGICDRCRTRIPLNRLRALPHTRFCRTCHRTGNGGAHTPPAGFP